MPLECDATFGNKCTGRTVLLAADLLTSSECLGFGKAETEEDNEYGRASTEPVQWPPAMRRGIDQGSGERSR